MNKPRLKGLGRGLDALLAANQEEEVEKGELQALPTIALQPGKYQPRTRMDPGSLEELAASIKAQGVMQPIMVRPVGEDGYEIIAGERRWRASQIAGLAEVPCLVREIPDEAALAMSLIENIQREDLNPCILRQYPQPTGMIYIYIGKRYLIAMKQKYPCVVAFTMSQHQQIS